MVVLAKLNKHIDLSCVCLEGWVGKSQGDNLKLSSVAVLCTVTRFPGSLMFMQGIGEGRGNREYTRGKLFWFSGLIKPYHLYRYRCRWEASSFPWE